ncbi:MULTISPECIES: acyl-CoA dehydrogenase family protein [Polyangium]|uniref:Acyl-CoA dehydrogenase n=2 Tax=Polyangium TaxID=55 RepID=A0A4U1JGK0_9BACT|nr:MULTISPECIES: acyl-CoA dehydrogenase family protein [Polyangium]MDI1435075.1 acyl-CoA dehydrogenase family protein [Polyangium sorediatum]TKD10458.1 acyl-CoA dehydrogenase [Polyangium fumosum]
MVDFSLSEEHKGLIETARRFTKERITPIAAACDHESRFPMDVFKEAWEIGLVNPTVPAEYGGSGMGELENAIITEELAYGCTGIQTSLLANGLALTPIKLGGSEEQKKKYLGLLTSEPVMASYATSEPDAGSDVAGIQTRFAQHGDDYVLNGQKCWITNASYARFYVIFATSNTELRHRGIAAFIVDRDTPGLRVGKKEDKLGQRASDTAQIFLEDVVVPKANLLAPEGKGFKLAMETFNQTRPDIGAGATGLMRRCLDECVAYAKERKTFGTPIANHQLVQWMIAEMAIRVEATRLLYQKAAWNLDHGVRDPIVSSFAKAYGADSAMQTAVDAVQVFGGNGYVKEYPVEKLMRDAKVLQIYEGTSQIQRIVIAKQLFGG